MSYETSNIKNLALNDIRKYVFICCLKDVQLSNTILKAYSIDDRIINELKIISKRNIIASTISDDLNAVSLTELENTILGYNIEFDEDTIFNAFKDFIIQIYNSYGLKLPYKIFGVDMFKNPQEYQELTGINTDKYNKNSSLKDLSKDIDGGFRTVNKSEFYKYQCFNYLSDDLKEKYLNDYIRSMYGNNNYLYVFLKNEDQEDKYILYRELKAQLQERQQKENLTEDEFKTEYKKIWYDLIKDIYSVKHEIKGIYTGRKEIIINLSEDITEAVKQLIRLNNNGFGVHFGIGKRTTADLRNQDIEDHYIISYDLDFKRWEKVPPSTVEVEETYRQVKSNLPIDPAFIYYSGAGLHVYYKLSEKYDISKYINELQAINVKIDSRSDDIAGYTVKKNLRAPYLLNNKAKYPQDRQLYKIEENKTEYTINEFIEAFKLNNEDYNRLEAKKEHIKEIQKEKAKANINKRKYITEPIEIEENKKKLLFKIQKEYEKRIIKKADGKDVIYKKELENLFNFFNIEYLPAVYINDGLRYTIRSIPYDDGARPGVPVYTHHRDVKGSITVFETHDGTKALLFEYIFKYMNNRFIEFLKLNNLYSLYTGIEEGKKISNYTLMDFYSLDIEKNYTVKKYINVDDITRILKDSESYKKIGIQAPTGSGKTTALINHTIQNNNKVIFLVPYRANPEQLEKEYSKYNVPCIYEGSKWDVYDIRTSNLIIATYDQLYKIVGEIKNHGFYDINEYNLIIDEYHNLVLQQFRSKALNRIHQFKNEFKKVMYITGTFEGLNVEDVPIYNINQQEKTPITKNYDIIKIRHDMDAIQYAKDRIIREDKNKSIVFLNDKEGALYLKKLLEMDGYNKEIEIINSDARGYIYDNIINKQHLEFKGLLICTSLISDGVNILDNDINTVYIVNNTNIPQVRQFIHRYRRGVHKIIHIIQTYKEETQEKYKIIPNEQVFHNAGIEYINGVCEVLNKNIQSSNITIDDIINNNLRYIQLTAYDKYIIRAGNKYIPNEYLLRNEYLKYINKYAVPSLNNLKNVLEKLEGIKISVDDEETYTQADIDKITKAEQRYIIKNEIIPSLDLKELEDYYTGTIKDIDNLTHYQKLLLKRNKKEVKQVIRLNKYINTDKIEIKNIPSEIRKNLYDINTTADINDPKFNINNAIDIKPSKFIKLDDLMNMKYNIDRIRENNIILSGTNKTELNIMVIMYIINNFKGTFTTADIKRELKKLNNCKQEIKDILKTITHKQLIELIKTYYNINNIREYKKDNKYIRYYTITAEVNPVLKIDNNKKIKTQKKTEEKEKGININHSESFKKYPKIIKDYEMIFYTGNNRQLIEQLINKGIITEDKRNKKYINNISQSD